MAERADVVAPGRLDIARLAPLDHLGVGQIPPAADEDFSIGIKASRLDTGTKEVGGRREAGLRRDNPVLEPGLQDVLAPVEVELVAERVAEAELDIREGAQLARLLAGVLDVENPQFTGACLVLGRRRNEAKQASGDSVVGAGDAGVAGAVAAFV